MNTIVVVENMPIHLPTLMQRAVLFPTGPEVDPEEVSDGPTPPFGKGHPGLNLEGSYLIHAVRGHARTDAVEGRKRWGHWFFSGRYWGDGLVDPRITGPDRELACLVFLNGMAAGVDSPRMLRPIAFLARVPNEEPGAEIFNDGTWAVRLLVPKRPPAPDETEVQR